jgi:hypothetical protein
MNIVYTETTTSSARGFFYALRKHMSHHLTNGEKIAVDAISVFTVVGTLANWLPAIAAALSIIWTAIRIYETKTVQTWLRGWRK